MNAQHAPAQFPQSTTSARIGLATTATSPRTAHRQRDFGVGYGSSSGYASSRRYVGQTIERMFRFV